MPAVTKITPQKKKGFYNVFIDGRFSFGLDAESLLKLALKEGTLLEVGEVKKLKEAAIFSRLLNLAFNFLSFRPRSKNEIVRYLGIKIRRNKEFEPLQGRIVERLKSMGLIDDESFARWLVEQRTGSKNPKGPWAIKAELLAKGVTRQLADRLVVDLGKTESEDNVSVFLQKKDKPFKTLPFFDRRRKLLALLLRRGFDFETSKKLVDKYLKGR